MTSPSFLSLQYDPISCLIPIPISSGGEVLIKGRNGWRASRTGARAISPSLKVATAIEVLASLISDRHTSL